MSNKRMTVKEMAKKYPNEWLFIVEPETREKTTHLISGIVKVHSTSREDVDKASRKFCKDAAIRFTGDYTSHRHKMTFSKPRDLK
ncbi:hypothetical protein C6497_07490 [Candidatus Poribacteria bacterium]|nr:MAG: hypothetical protein C6497_07490 [Candidatus Poribacteria bacterium]